MVVRRFYRDWLGRTDLHHFRVAVEQTDLAISCSLPLARLARDAVVQARQQVLHAIDQQPAFATSLSPIDVPDAAPPLAHTMASAAAAWSVGPMAAVAGAIAQSVGRALAQQADHVVVENGGDAFVLSPNPVRFALYAGHGSPFAERITFSVDASGGLGVCTSSGRVGPSLSFGNADAVVAISPDAAIADAAATSLANRIQGPGDVEPLVRRESERGALTGLIACCADRFGAWGAIELGQR